MTFLDILSFNSKSKLFQTTLRQQIHRLRKKVTDMKHRINKSEPITADDRFVYTKNA